MKIRASKLLVIKIGNKYLSCRYILDKYHNSFKNNDIIRASNKPDNSERNNVITFLLQNDFEKWSDFVSYVEEKANEIRKSFVENGSNGLPQI